jgi:heat shock protein 1/8
VKLQNFHSLPGEDFDNRLLNHFVKEFQQKHGINLLTAPKALKKLKSKCTEAKHMLSQSLSVRIQSLNKKKFEKNDRKE